MLQSAPPWHPSSLPLQGKQSRDLAGAVQVAPSQAPAWRYPIAHAVQALQVHWLSQAILQEGWQGHMGRISVHAPQLSLEGGGSCGL